MVEAARKTNQIVQVGLQRHSSQYVQEAVARVQVGEIGKVTVERCFPLTKKFPVGIGSHEDCDPPTMLGLAPRVPYNPSRYLCKFRWF